MRASELETLIAKAIRRADSRYFFENYSLQAEAVIRALKKEGLVIAPIDPDESMVKEGVDSILSGKIPPEMHVSMVYSAMVGAKTLGSISRKGLRKIEA